MGSSATPFGKLSTVVVRSVALVGFGAALFLLPEAVDDTGAAALMPDLVVLGFIQLIPLIFSRRRDLFAPPIYFGLIGAFATLAMGAYLAEYGPRAIMVRREDPEAQIQLVRLCLATLGVGSLAYQVGFYLKARPRLVRYFPDVAGLVWDRRRLLLILGGIVGAATIAYVYFQLRLGVPLTELTALRAGKEALLEDRTQTWITRGVQFAFLPGLLLLGHGLGRSRGWRGLILPGLVMAISALLIFRTSLRGTVAQALICATVLFHYLRYRISPSVFVGLYLLGVSFANLALEWRAPTGDSGREVSAETILVSPLETLSRHELERSRLDAMAVVLDYFPDQHDFLYGESYLAFLVVPIPRWIWPEKREFARWADNALPNVIAGLPAPPALPVALYANFSWIGILVGMFFFGVMQRALYDWFQRDPRDPSVVLLYAVILLYFTPTLLGISFTLQYVLPIWVVLRVIGRRPAEPAPA